MPRSENEAQMIRDLLDDEKTGGVVPAEHLHFWNPKDHRAIAPLPAVAVPAAPLVLIAFSQYNSRARRSGRR